MHFDQKKNPGLAWITLPVCSPYRESFRYTCGARNLIVYWVLRLSLSFAATTHMVVLLPMSRIVWFQRFSSCSFSSSKALGSFWRAVISIILYKKSILLFVVFLYAFYLFYFINFHPIIMALHISLSSAANLTIHRWPYAPPLSFNVLYVRMEV